MHSIKFSEVARILGVTPVQLRNDASIEVLLTDSRKLSLPQVTLFFTISTGQKDASQFIPELYENGVRCFVTSLDFDECRLAVLPEASIIKTGDVLLALQQLAAAHRHRFQYPVIGITGSNGKTTVKEWLFQLLSTDFNIVRSPKSYNSQVGVPLSVWNMSDTHTLGMFEAGISLPGEMDRLQKVIDPEIGIFTFIGDAHSEGFENIRKKIHEKLLLFKNSKVLVYCADDECLQDSVLAFKAVHNNNIRLFGWSLKPGVEIHISKIGKEDNGCNISCRYNERELNFYIPFTDDASIHNAITCCCVLLYMNISFSAIASHIAQLSPVEMRLELKEGLNNCSIINDSYSTDLNSFSIALHFLLQQQQHNKRTVILSDVLQSSIQPDELYSRISEILNNKEIYRFIGIGPQISANAHRFHKIPNAHFFPSTTEFLKHLPAMQFRDETILLKGARVFRFEQVSHVLEQKRHETVLEINLDALRDNLKMYRQQLNGPVKMMAMVKAFSYGSGSYEIAGLLQHAAIDYLAVAYADEGVTLRRAGIRVPIMVMNTEMTGFDNVVQFRLEPELYSFSILYSFDKYLQQHGLENYPVHLKLDTGMHRLGFLEEDLPDLCSYISGSKRMKIISAFSHLVASDDPVHDAFTNKQAEAFNRMVNRIQEHTGYPFIRHIANTSAIHRHPQLQYDMVRLGIGLYGVDEKLKLRNVTTLKTTISQIKKVRKGETVGYNRKGVVERDSLIAIVRIGYADGYPRSLGNGVGKMLHNGRLVPVIGNVCMDMTMLDITGSEAAEADEVIVFGEELPVTQLAAWANTIPYEILTGISQRVKRVYFEE